MPEERTGVVIVGGGPTGVLLSALLGQAQVPNIVLEREANIVTDPRGIVLDEDGVRILQSLGVYDKVFTEIGSCMFVRIRLVPLLTSIGMQRFNFISGTGSDLFKKPMLSVDYTTSEGGTGHVGFICHKQPVLERTLRDCVAAHPDSELRTQCTVTAISDDEDRVTVHYVDAIGQQKSIRASFLVGADGKTGYVRKRYLEPKGITMDKCEGTNYEETWVALNWKITPPTEKSHPDFPLWRLGYTPTEVYDLFFPKEFRFLCNPDRPSVCGRFGLPNDRLWRFEFVVHEGEDGIKMATPEEHQKIIFPYLTHPGSRYGLQQPVSYPADCIECLRSRPFSFSARSCNKWALGRVILTGDAAHVFPPFGGQGIASGFRDAFALAWRLRLLYQEPTANHEQVLRAWYLERKQQLERSLAATIQNGEYVTERDPFKVFIRDWSLWFMHLVPSWRRQLEAGPRAKGMAKYAYVEGLPLLPSGGLLLPQVYAWDYRSSRVAFSDDVLFSETKKGLLQLLLLPDTTAEATQLVQELQRVPPQRHVAVEEATVLIQHVTIDSSHVQLGGEMSVARVATGDEFAQSELCQNRPDPKYYDPCRISKELPGMKYVLVRPDRFVIGAFRDSGELAEAVGGLANILLP